MAPLIQSILFVNLDGGLAPRGEPVAAHAVRDLELLCSEARAGVVLTGPFNGRYHDAGLSEVLYQHGFRGTILAELPRPAEKRGLAIWIWWQRRGRNRPFAILDADRLQLGRRANHHLITNPAVGFGAAEIRAAHRILTRRPKARLTS